MVTIYTKYIVKDCHVHEIKENCLLLTSSGALPNIFGVVFQVENESSEHTGHEPTWRSPTEYSHTRHEPTWRSPIKYSPDIIKII